MKYTLLIAAGLVGLGLSACDKPTSVILPAPVVAPGPAGPAGPQGPAGNTGESGRPGEPAAVIVLPPASAPSS